MTEYKDTLNLPNTSFPMKANLSQREPQMLAEWVTKGVYKKIRAKRVGCKRFILHDGPPYANGHLHCGHALNKILKDIIIKSKTLSGYDAPFVPGWDCHGLPVELNVEKKVGKAGVKISATEFRRKCREYAGSQIDIQRDEFQRLGVFGDWQNPYATMDFSYEANIVRALAKIIENGHLQQGFKPVHWCVDCGSALAEAEVDYEDKTSSSIDVAFYALDPNVFLAKFDAQLPQKPLIVPIWTTTPWTLPANEAVCLNPSLGYTLIDAGEHYFIVATDLVSSVMERFDVVNFTTHGTAFGAAFDKILVKHPFNDRLVPIVLGEHVTTDSGTGCVHTAPAHGPDDYQVGQKYGLPLINPVLGNGCFAEDVPLLAGIPVLKANSQVLDILREHSTLLHDELLTHSYPHCWRHKTPMIFRATPQWFISMDKNGLRDQLLEQINQVNWVPDWGKARISNMVESRPDWCVSRQRAWNTPMPLFVHKSTRALHPDTVQLIEKVAIRIEKIGVDAWFDLDASELLGDDAEFYEKISDTLDVWFDSGVVHAAVLETRPELQSPADLYLEGSDQHRGWFQSSLLTSVAMRGRAPYKTVLTHGFVVDASGHKMSKSLGNVVDPQKIMSTLGADVLRLWVSATDYRMEMCVSEEILKRTSDAYRRIRNTARFLLANLEGFDPKEHLLPENDLLALDAWIVGQAHECQAFIQEAYASYNFHSIYQKIQQFCIVELGGFYLDVIKDRQYTAALNSRARRSAQTALYHVIEALVRWIAPILSFTADEIWDHMPNRTLSSVLLAEWYTGLFPLSEKSLLTAADWEQLLIIRQAVTKGLEQARAAGQIGSGLEAELDLYVEDSLAGILGKLQNELRFVFITSAARVHALSEKPEQAVLGEGLDNLYFTVSSSQAPKCVRCWHRCADVNSHAHYPDICGRCVTNISDPKGEARLYA